MLKQAFAVFLVTCAPALAETQAAAPADLKSCPPIGQSAKGELIYSLDCSAIKTEYPTAEYKPDMPATNMKDTVIPKPGKVQTPDTTPTTGEVK